MAERKKPPVEDGRIRVDLTEEQAVKAIRHLEAKIKREESDDVGQHDSDNLGLKRVRFDLRDIGDALYQVAPPEPYTAEDDPGGSGKPLGVYGLRSC